MKTATQEEYLADSGKCPCCGSTYIEGGCVEVEKGTAHQEIVCNNCYASWVDEYKLVGYSSLERGST